ncbi:MAG: outer membrane beta-barrel protein [Bacteroidaceae bacterium]|nr:outer membrane beta-barrel protein [Bacteroidaceae bacterium]
MVNARDFYCSGKIMDSVTHEGVPGTIVYIMNQDSVVLDSMYSTREFQNFILRSQFIFKVKGNGIYILWFRNKDYQDSYQTVNLKFNPKRGIYSQFIDDVFLIKKKKVHQIGNAVIKATRLKMYYKGDTLVYDADAFNLSKGSTLSNLLEEMPGVVLKEDGRIFVNGRYVDELLLNSRDFFGRDRKIMFENIPSYIVRDIKIYEKRSIMDLGKDKLPLVMNVELKKEYRIGWINNLDLASGTNDRYLEKLFSMRYSDHSKLVTFVNFNNVNDQRKPGESVSSNWQPLEQISGGSQKNLKVGVDYDVYERKNRYNYHTSNLLNTNRTSLIAQQSTHTFLTKGDLFSLNLKNTLSHFTNWSTKNMLAINSIEKLVCIIDLNMEYKTFDSRYNISNVTLDVSPDSLKQITSIDQVSMILPTSRWYNHILNRMLNEDYSRGYLFDTNEDISRDYSPWKQFNDCFNCIIDWDYNKQNNTAYSLNRIEYPANGKEIDFRHNYIRTPVKNYKVGMNINYNMVFESNEIYYSYQYNHSYDSSDRCLFRLDKLSQKNQLEYLPSTYDSLQSVMDARNSYYSETRNDKHQIELKFSGKKEQDKGTFDYMLIFPFSLNYDYLNYHRNELDTIASRHIAFITPTFNLEWKTKENGTSLGVNYNINHSVPSLFYRMRVRDDVNPLDISINNPNLKNTVIHHTTFSYNYHKDKKYQNLSAIIDYTVIKDAIAMGVIFDEKTGIRQTRPDNVEGNWNIDFRTNFSRAYFKNNNLSIDSHIGLNYQHSVDLTGTTDGLGVERSVVHNVNLNEEFGLNYKIGQNKVGLKGKVAWSDITSGRANFQNMNVWDFQYGVTELWNLPLKLQLSTDLTMFSRRGYELKSMNTNDLVWNARLSRTFLNGNLTCFVDGFDILGKLSNIYRSVNAQGRTETRYNVVPRYVMLHVIYRLNVQPKKNK